MESLTDTFRLPVCGLEAVISEPDGNDETTVYSRGKSRARALAAFWARCLVRLGDIEKPGVDDLLKLLEPDYIQIGLHVHCLATAKSTIVLKGACGRCGKPNAATIDLEKWMDPTPPVDLTPPAPTWQITLPRTGHLVVYGYATAGQELAELEREDIDLNRMDLMHIRTVNGSPVKFREVAGWPMPDHIALREAIKARQEWYETRIGVRHSCGFWEEINLMLDPTFLSPGVIV